MMNKRLLLSITLCGALSMGITLHAQNTNYAAPDAKMMAGGTTAAGLGSISSPGLFNGSVNIHIPIYSFEHGGTELGVSLSYNTKGVPVDEISNQPGLHWNLQTVPGITRIVRDFPDELQMNFDSLFTYELSTGHDTVMVNHEMHVKGKWLTYSETQQQQQAHNIYRDGECDQFVVSLGSGTFSFYIGNNFKIYTTPHRNVKVQILKNGVPVANPGSSPNTALGFKITDEQGNQYVFESVSSQQVGVGGFADWQAAGFGNLPITVKTPIEWKVKEIILEDGAKISYTYASGSSYYKPFKSYYVQEKENGSRFLGRSVDNTYMEYAYLSSIKYPNGNTVSFTYNTNKENELDAPMLAEININGGNNCKRFKFYQDKVKGRWYLNRITQLSCDGSMEEPYYSFTYNPILKIIKLTLPDHSVDFDTVRAMLPARLNSGQDLYGYYNGDSIGVAIETSTKDISIPKHQPAVGINYGSERQYVAKYAQAGLLCKVKNAYGETVRYTYEANQISSIPLQDKIPTDNNFIGAGQPDGVRVDSVIKTDIHHPDYKLITAFQYSGGQIFMPGGYFHYPNYIDSASGEWQTQTFQNYFLTAHQMVNGSNHGYSGVSIKAYANAQLLSRTDYKFTNMQDATSGNAPRYVKLPGSTDYFQYPYTDKQYLKSWAIGLPLSVTSYDQNNRIVKQVVNKYDFSGVDQSAASYVKNKKVAKVNSGERSVGISSGQGIGGLWIFYPYQKTFTDPYYPFTGTAHLVRSINRKYISDTRFVADTVWYYYDGHNNLTRTVTQNSKGEKTETHLVYNYDVDGPTAITGLATSHPGTTLYNMTNAGLEVPVATERWKITQQAGGNDLLSAFITRYQYQDGKLWTKGLLNTELGKPLSFTQYAGSPVNGVYVHRYDRILAAYNTANDVDNYVKTSQVTLFDAKGNPLETQLQDEDQYKAMVWDTTREQKVAEAANCRYSDIAYTSFESDLQEGNLSWQGRSYITLSSGAITGTHTGLLWTQMTPGSAISILGTKNLKAHKEYILSFWVYGTTPSVKVGSQAILISSADLAYTKGSWKNYQVRFTPNAAGKIKITGTAAFSQIDEIRLFPSDAQMQSWTYEPLLGKSSYTGSSGRVTYYRYDKMGRQNLVLDQDGNVLSKTDYHVAQ